MKKLKIKLRKSELEPINIFIGELMQRSMSDLDYVEYYNLKVLQKSLLDKRYKLMENFDSKEINIPFDINAYSPMIRLFNLNDKYISRPGNEYLYVIFKSIIDTLIKQYTNLQKPQIII